MSHDMRLGQNPSALRTEPLLSASKQQHREVVIAPCHILIQLVTAARIDTMLASAQPLAAPGCPDRCTTSPIDRSAQTIRAT